MTSEHNITGDKLKDLTAHDLKAMGIKESKDYLKILNIIKKVWQIKDEPKVFNDSVHGHMELHPLLVQIIDTPQFQRLRNIKQLGGAYFVYPGASHNRFEHSIGVAYLAGELAQTLKTKQNQDDKNLITQKDILCVQIAGLCHDLGHGPFSHLFDGMFLKDRRPDIKGDEGNFEVEVKFQVTKHEDLSKKMFKHLVEQNGLKPLMELYGLDDTDMKFIKEMIKPKTHNSNEEWKHKGRPVEKSFLYEIVSNKTNGIDVDKFDYFARDCHHLGIKTNFDHRRFIMFARVCEVKENGRVRKHICTRDKEEHNLYEMFHTRYCLHRSAYQHKVNKTIETMIKDAFLKVDRDDTAADTRKDPYIQIKGSNGKMFSLSTAIDDMEAYTKLTDHVFEQILHSSSEELKEAREILERIISRDLYEWLGELPIKTEITDEKTDITKEKPDITKEKPDITKEMPDITKEMTDTWKKELAELYNESDAPLKPENFEVVKITMDYGMKEKNPIENMFFYKKSEPNEAFRIPRDPIDEVSKIRPVHFSESFFYIWYKETDKKSVAAAKKSFEKWGKKKEKELLR